MDLLPFDEIHIDTLEIFANHGVFAEETTLGQKFLLSITLYTNTSKAGISDDLTFSTDYGDVAHFASTFTKQHARKLIEAAAEDLACAILKKYPLLAGIRIQLEKPWAPIGLPLQSVSVTISRFWHTAYLGIGSNMGNKKQYLDMAIQQLNEDEKCHVKKVSSYLETKPYGGVKQEDFLNACLCIKTLYLPMELLNVLHHIEENAHRERIVHWGPRTLDLDILLYDNLVMEREELILPHADMLQREFVLRPLAEIAPFKRHPIAKKTIQQLLQELLEKNNNE